MNAVIKGPEHAAKQLKPHSNLEPNKNSTYSAHQHPLSAQHIFRVHTLIGENLWNPGRLQTVSFHETRREISPSTCIQVSSSVYQAFQSSSALRLHCSVQPVKIPSAAAQLGVDYHIRKKKNINTLTENHNELPSHKDVKYGTIKTLWNK